MLGIPELMQNFEVCLFDCFSAQGSHSGTPDKPGYMIVLGVEQQLLKKKSVDICSPGKATLYRTILIEGAQ